MATKVATLQRPLVNIKQTKALLCITLAIILICSCVGGMVLTGFGKVTVRSINFVTDDGANLNGLLYLPKSIASGAKLPAIISCHGWNNTAEVQGMNAIELSRRGYVVFSVDAYGHGQSTFPQGVATTDDLADGVADGKIAVDLEGDAVVSDLGVYAALQYIGNQPYVDAERIGMVGHSMGGGAIQSAAWRAFQHKQNNPGIIVPKAVLPTAQAFTTNADYTSYLLQDYPVNLGAVYSRWDEWAKPMWAMDKGLDVNRSPKTAVTFGIDAVNKPITYGSYYSYGQEAVINRTAAIDASQTGMLRVIYQPLRTHPGTHNDSNAIKYIIDFFNITLKQGAADPIPPTDQIWLIKDICGLLALTAFFIFLLPMTALLLQIPYFSSLVRPVYDGVKLDNPKSKLRYVIWFLIGLLPGALLCYICWGYPIAIKAMNRFVPIPLGVSSYFQMPIMNGLVLFNVLAGVAVLLLFLLSKKMSGSTEKAADWGIVTNLASICKALLLAAIVFFSGYLLLVLSEFLFGVDFRFFTLSMKTLTNVKWLIYLKYLPFWIFFYVINSLVLNINTAIAGKKEWLNYLLCALATVGGVLVLHALDYGCLYITGVRMFLTTPFPTTQISALAGVLAWGLMYILPLAGIMSRYIYKHSGNVWLAGLVNSLAITLFAISNTAIGIGMI